MGKRNNDGAPTALATAYAHLFDRRPSPSGSGATLTAAPKKKRNWRISMPAKVAELDSSTHPVFVADRWEKSEGDKWHDSKNETQITITTKAAPTKRKRARSLSAVVFRSNRQDDDKLKPTTRPRKSTMGAVAGPEAAYKPALPSAPHPAAIMDPSTRGFAAAAQQHGPGPQRMTRKPQPLANPHSPRRPSMQNQQQQQYYERPRAPTGSSMTSVGSVSSNGSFDARSMHSAAASPASGRSSFTSFDSLDLRAGPRQPEQGWQRPAPIKQYRRRREPNEILSALPAEVVGLILGHLRQRHMEDNPRGGDGGCATCLMRDLCSLSVASRKMCKLARPTLYEHIELVGADSPAQKKRYKLSFGSRLVLLRRTLRARPQLAAHVRTLKAPAIPFDAPSDKYLDLVASVVMACPNLERLVGFHPPYDHAFTHLTHALSTRDKLKEMNWFLDASPLQDRPADGFEQGGSGSGPAGRAGSMTSSRTGTSSITEFPAPPGDIQPEQSVLFQDLHANWAQLETLSIHCMQGATLTPVSLLSSTLALLPSLRHLHLSDLPFTAFNDTSLLSLPPLESLSLTNLCGVSRVGLSSFARRPSSHSLRALSLRHVGLDSLPVLGRLLSHLTQLESFALVQERAPLLPEGESVWLFPYVASVSLRKLHWDISSNPHCANNADVIVAKSIAAKGFPALRQLRAPNDPEGIFQCLCRPVERIDVDQQLGRNNSNGGGCSGGGLIQRAGNTFKPSPPLSPNTPTTPGTPRTPIKSPMGFKFADLGEHGRPRPKCSDLAAARSAAQSRIEAMREAPPRFLVNVYEEDGTLVDKFGLGQYIGEVGSPIRYCVQPDPGAQDENGGLVDAASDLLRDCGEDTKQGAAEVCTGRWNAWEVNDRKDRDRWWHTERGLWRGAGLSG